MLTSNSICYKTIGLLPICQNKVLCKTIRIKNVSTKLHANETHFPMKGFAQGLILKQTHKVTTEISYSSPLFKLYPKK